MVRTKEPNMPNPGSGLFRRLFSCTPRPQDSDNVINANGSNANNLTLEMERNLYGAQAASPVLKDGQSEKKSMPNMAGAVSKRNTEKKRTPAWRKATRNPSRENPLKPLPPSDEATPVISNRKSAAGERKKRSDQKNNIEFISATGRRLEEVVGSEPPSAFVEAMEAAIQQAERSEAFSAELSSIPEDAKSPYPTFQNTHPVHDNLKQKCELYETAFSGTSTQQLDGTESTEDVTESTISGEYIDEVTKVKQVPNGDEPIVDCADDPWDHAYAVWYRKGLLKWRPKSVVDDNEIRDPLNDRRNGSKFKEAVEIVPVTDLLIVESPVLQTPSAAEAVSKIEEKIRKHGIDDAELLHKYRNKSVSTVCANCSKDTTYTFQLVRCLQCKQELYCSVFCRGNDRYKHAAHCIPAVASAASNTSKMEISSTLNKKATSQKEVLLPLEEKKEEPGSPSIVGQSESKEAQEDTEEFAQHSEQFQKEVPLHLEEKKEEPGSASIVGQSESKEAQENYAIEEFSQQSESFQKEVPLHLEEEKVEPGSNSISGQSESKEEQQNQATEEFAQQSEPFHMNKDGLSTDGVDFQVADTGDAPTSESLESSNNGSQECVNDTSISLRNESRPDSGICVDNTNLGKQDVVMDADSSTPASVSELDRVMNGGGGIPSMKDVPYLAGSIVSTTVAKFDAVLCEPDNNQGLGVLSALSAEDSVLTTPKKPKPMPTISSFSPTVFGHSDSGRAPSSSRSSSLRKSRRAPMVTMFGVRHGDQMSPATLQSKSLVA